jgi:hypothetical protein
MEGRNISGLPILKTLPPPARRWRIELGDPASGEVLTVTAGPDGRFEKRGLAPGPVRIHARRQGLDGGVRSLLLPPGTIDLALALPQA